MQVVVPRSGTPLFADLWVVPRQAQGGHMQVRAWPLVSRSRPWLKLAASAKCAPSGLAAEPCSACVCICLPVLCICLQGLIQTSDASHLVPIILQVGPSPLLPSWLEFGLSPARIAAHSGLKSGAAPALLPDRGPGLHKPASQHPPSTPSQQGQQGQQTLYDENILCHATSYMPTDTSTLVNSEFLMPLDSDTVALYRDALALSSTPETASSPSPSRSS